VVIGVSTDNLESQRKFAQQEKLNFPLGADSDKKVAEAFGVLGKAGFAQRWTFVIDKKGVVRKVYMNVKPAEHPDEVLAYVKENLKK
jgi:peroxiredoxin Q/BCP